MSSFNYERYDRRQTNTSRSTLGYYVPLIFTVTVATAGLAAWVWSARESGEDYNSDDDLSYGEDSQSDRRRGKGAQRDLTGMSESAVRDGVVREEDTTLFGRAQGIIRRTPSPSQVFDSVSKKTAAGWAAASGAAGAALASIREEDKDDYGDHSRWSEEASLRRNVEAQSSQSTGAVDTQTRSFAASVRNGPSNGKRKTVVLVVSAESLMDSDDHHDGNYRTETATILSHLPNTDFNKTKLFVLIYAPSSRSRPHSRAGTSSLGDSYSAISTPARTPGEELQSIDPQPEDLHRVYTPAHSTRSSDNVLWNTLHAQALRLVENPSMVMPFSVPSGYVHMVRHIGPDLVYVVDALSGMNGANIEDVKKWVGQTIVVVGSDGTGLGGLVDTDDEAPANKAKSEHSVSKWWESADMVGLGKGVEVVDGSRFGDDYERRTGAQA